MDLTELSISEYDDNARLCGHCLHWYDSRSGPCPDCFGKPGPVGRDPLTEEWKPAKLPRLWCSYASREMVWFRVFGWGLCVTDHRVSTPSFSERYGYAKTLHVGPFCFKILRGDKYGR